MNATDLETGDILLFRKRTLLGKAIARMTDSCYCHVAIVGIDTDYLIEIAPFRFNRYRLITDYAVETIDVFRLEGMSFGFHALVTSDMAAIAKRHPYSFVDGVKAGLRCCTPKPLLWIWGKAEPENRFHCSGAISAAYRKNGIDLCPNVSDWQTTPGHLAKSKKIHFIGKLDICGFE